MTFVFTKDTQLTRGKLPSDDVSGQRIREPITDNHRSPYRTDIFIKVSISIQGAFMCLDCFGGQTVNSLSSHKNTEWWDWCNALVQKSASTYVTEFVPDVVQTVERKMKVDDFIKSPTIAKTAVGFRHSNESC